MTRLFDCPFCGGLIKNEKQFGIETCPTCGQVMGIGDLLINQNALDKARDEECKAELAAENAWLRAAENAGEYDPHEEYLMSIDPQILEAEERMYQDRLVWEAHEDLFELLLEGGM